MLLSSSSSRSGASRPSGWSGALMLRLPLASACRRDQMRPTTFRAIRPSPDRSAARRSRRMAHEPPATTDAVLALVDSRAVIEADKVVSAELGAKSPTR